MGKLRYNSRSQERRSLTPKAQSCKTKELLKGKGLVPAALSHSTEMVQELRRVIKDRTCRKLGQWVVIVWRKDMAGTEILKMRGWEDQKAGTEFVRNTNPSGRVRESCKG